MDHWHTSHAGHIHSTCRSHAHHMQVTYTSHAGHMHITCRSHIHHMCVTCTSHSHCVCIQCFPSCTIFRPDKSGRLYVSYEVIGRNMVSVPTHFFKVIAYQDVHSPKLSVEVGQVIFANRAQYHMCGVVVVDHHH